MLIKSYTGKYTLAGVLFGLCFPALSTLLYAYIELGDVSIANLILVQAGQPLLWVIDTAPLFLGLFASIGGIKYDKLIETERQRDMLLVRLQQDNGLLEERVNERTIQLTARTVEALQAAEVKSRFLTNMSHEIRSPMNGVMDMIQLLEVSNLDQQQRHYLQTTRKSSILLMDIVDEILDYAKLEQGEVELECVRFDMCYLIHDVVDMSSTNAAAKGLAMDCAIDLPLDGYYQGDPFRIKQVLMNMVNNAIKFTESGFVKVSVVKIGDAQNCDVLQFTVEDSGIGIDPDAQHNLYWSFEQADTSTTRCYGGTGLGLAIVKELVSLMRGELGVSSRPCMGSRFWVKVTLPRVQKPEDLSTLNINPVNVMVVEGNASLSKSLHKQLARLKVNNVVHLATATRAMA